MGDERRIPGIYRAMTEAEPLEGRSRRSVFWHIGALAVGAIAFVGCGGTADDLGSGGIDGIGDDLDPMDGRDDGYYDDGKDEKCKDDKCKDDETATGTGTGDGTKTDTATRDHGSRDCDTGTGDSDHSDTSSGHSSGSDSKSRDHSDDSSSSESRDSSGHDPDYGKDEYGRLY